MSNNKQNSVKILVEVEFEIDDIWSANSVDQEERAWFWNKVIPSCNILLHSNEVGDTVGETNTFTIKKISRKAREYTSPIIEELLNEKTMEMSNNKQTALHKDKTLLITWLAILPFTGMLALILSPISMILSIIIGIIGLSVFFALTVFITYSIIKN